jgi:hypothetical protein
MSTDAQPAGGVRHPSGSIIASDGLNGLIIMRLAE